jgi:hypothetical protein
MRSGLLGDVVSFAGGSCSWTDRLRYGGLEEAAKLGMRRSMCGKNLSEGEECRQSSDMVLVERSAHLREVKYLLVKHKS